MTARPQLWIFAGPNGSGKSTLVSRFHIAERMTIVNPDVIASRLSKEYSNEPAVMLKAGRIASAERRKLILERRSFAMETTLTGHSELRIMRDAQDAGYKITLVFVGLDDALTSLARVRERVARGGHDVPVPVILRRYAKSSASLPIAAGIADRCFILDNSGNRHRLLITIDRQQVRHRSRRLPGWVKAAFPTTP